VQRKKLADAQTPDLARISAALGEAASPKCWSSPCEKARRNRSALLISELVAVQLYEKIRHRRVAASVQASPSEPEPWRSPLRCGELDFTWPGASRAHTELQLEAAPPWVWMLVGGNGSWQGHPAAG